MNDGISGTGTRRIRNSRVGQHQSPHFDNSGDQHKQHKHCQAEFDERGALRIP
jgi:hypothetical protein